jgi:hypothetical protein
MGRLLSAALVLTIVACGVGGCGGSRVITTTGTTLGLKATPGDGQMQPPQITFGYKRAEASLVPTRARGATREGAVLKDDAYSTLSSFYFSTEWFGATHIASFIGTGFAARDIMGADTVFGEAFEKATVRTIASVLQNRRTQLVQQASQLGDAQVTRVLGILAAPVPPGQTPQEALRGLIADAETEAQIARIGDAFNQVR